MSIQVWDTQEFDISNIFMIYKMAAVDKAKKHTLSYINTVGEILALSSILLMEENSFRGMTGLPQDIYQIMRRKFGKKSLPKEVIELCQRCAIVGRENSKTDLENEIDEAYIVIRKSVSSENQKLYRTVRQNWRTSFNEGISIEDTFVHHSLYPLLRPFFPDTVNWVINWANKESLSSTFGSKPDFNVAIRLCDHNYFEILFGLFKSPKKANTKSASIDLVDLGNENSFRGMTGLPQDIYQIMRRKFGKKSLPKEVIELCQRCAIVGRENSKTDLENEIDEAYIVIRKSVSSENQKLYRTVRQNWRTSFNEGISIEDTFVHHSLYPLLRPFFPDTVNWVINWANKESLSSTFGSKPDFNVAIRLCDHNYFEILFGLFKSPKKANTKSASIDLVDLGNVMKDSIDFIYHNYHTDLEIRTYGLHVFGYNARIYVMGLNFDGVYQMYLLGEFELSRSHLSFSLVEGAIYQISNLSMIVEEDIKRLNSSPMTPITTKLMSPTMKMTMTRSTVGGSQ
ncbi:16526_t:CDS:10 [Entrophospora sp. SA101]|nr:16526_t:CDS:10 [Entrophospora sp. SA101]